MQFNVLSPVFIYAWSISETLHMPVLSDGRHSYIHVHTFQRNLSVLNWVIFHLKSVYHETAQLNV